MAKITFALTLCLILCVVTDSNAQSLNIVQIAKLAQLGQIAQVGQQFGNQIEQFIRKPNFAKQADDESDCPMIKTKLGYISGLRQQVVLGNGTFCSYRGIRYAEPPIGKLRFKAPVKSGKWKGTFNATEYGATCYQMLHTKYPTRSEDCLFLNVFVPDSTTCSNTSNIAVIVFMIGGAFTSGAAYDGIYGPHLIMNHCVILVTLNYRLGVFGFLPLALPEYSGNMGLKDQQLGLQWVNEHISAFGGNPKRVTLFGQSSGGTSASFQRLNQKSRSLFQQAYVVSGSALCYYAVCEINNKTDLIVKLAREQFKFIDNTEQLLEYLQTVDTEYIFSRTDQTEGFSMIFQTPWQPVIESETAINPFLTEDPEIILAKDANVNVPTVYSHASMEYIPFSFTAIAFPKSINYSKENPKFLLPFRGIDQKACEKEIAPLFTDIRQFYYGNANEGQIETYLRLTSYVNLVYPIHKEIVIQALAKSHAKLHLLRINQRTALNLFINIPEIAHISGVGHGDDICNYFWCGLHSNLYDEIAEQKTLSDRIAFKASQIFREILTNFAITGNPSSETASFDSLVSITSEPLTHLPFTEFLSMGTLASSINPDHEEFKFWWKIDQRLEEIKKMPCNNDK